MINFNETVIKIVLVVLNEKNAHSNYESFFSFLFIYSDLRANLGRPG